MRLMPAFIIMGLGLGCASLPHIEHKRGANPDVAIRHYQEHSSEVRDCIQGVVNKDRSLVGKITLEWTVDDQGKVIDSGIKERTVNSIPIETCLLNHVRGLQFPPTPMNSTATIIYTYNIGEGQSDIY